jgi:ADP-heptose:LPS heptosyltransferase
MSLQEIFEWQPEASLNKKLKPISKTQMRNLGLSDSSNRIVNDLEELKEDPPNIVIATSLSNMQFTQNYFKKQNLKKGVSYIMSLGVYQQLFSDPQRSKSKFLKPSNIRFKNIYRPYRGEALEDKRLLIFRTGGIGDLLFIQPNLNYLKKKYPTCEIVFACGPQYQSMVEMWDCVDEVLDLPFTLGSLQKADYHALFEGVIERCKLAETINAYNLFSEWLGLNLPNELLLPKQQAKEEKVMYCIEKLSEWKVEPKDFIIMQLRASSPIRTPRPKFWVDMIDSLTDRGHKIVLTDNPRQAQFVDDFIKLVKNKEKVFNFCQYSKTLDYSIALTQLAKGVVATDSALNHIAASLDVACYGIYGPFPGNIRLKTYPKARWVDAKKDCAPCYIHSPLPCPKAMKDKFSPCYDNIDIGKTVFEIEELFNYG